MGNAHATDGIPNHHALPFFVDMVGDDTQEIGVGDGLFIGSDMDVGRIDEDFSHLVENVFQLFHSLCRLHGMTHGAGESCAVSWHVDFGNHRDAVFRCRLHYLTAFLLRVVMSSEARHGRCLRELRILFHFETPCLVLRQVEVEGVHLETSEEAQLLLQFLYADKTSANVVHIASDLEGGPVYDFAGFHLAVLCVALGQLRQCLYGSDYTRFCGCRNPNALAVDSHAIGLVGKALQEVVVGSFDAVYECDFHMRSLFVGGGMLTG